MKKSLTRRRLDAFIEKATKDVEKKITNTDRAYLDLGCGGSPYTHLFRGWKRTGFDFAPRKGVDVVGDVHDLPFEDASFDLVFSTEVLEHASDPLLMLKEAYRILKPGGTIILTTRFIFPVHQAPYDHFRFTEYGLRHLFTEAAFLDVTLEADTTSLEAIGVQLDVLARNSQASKFSKAILYGFGWLFKHMPKLTKKEYGDMRRDNTVPLQNIMTSGYHVVAKKGSGEI